MGHSSTRTFNHGDSLIPIDSIAQTDAFAVTPSVTLAKGTVVGVVTATKKLKAYASGNSDGSEVPIGLLKYATTTDAEGYVVTTMPNGDVLKQPTATVYRSGKFQAYTVNPTTGLPTATTLLPGLDSNAITKLGRMVNNILELPAA
jgi:hypothetical protein